MFKGEIRNRVGIMLGLVHRSNESVAGTTERAVKARTVHRLPAGQQGDARHAKSIRGVPWQSKPPRRLWASLWAWHVLSVFRWF